MSAQKFVQTFTAGQLVRFPAGRYFYINLASTLLDIVTEGNPGSPVRFGSVGAGTKFGPVGEGEGWRFLAVTSPGAQNVEITISDDGNFEVAAAVTVAGTVTTSPAPASSTTNTAPVDAANAAETPLIAANLSRRGVWITADSSNTDGGSPTTHAVIRAQTGGNAIDEIQPGVGKFFPVTHGLWVRNDTGAVQRFYVREEIP